MPLRLLDHSVGQVQQLSLIIYTNPSCCLQVQGMQGELETLQPQLIASSAETAELLGVITAQTAEADVVKKVVQVRDT